MPVIIPSDEPLWMCVIALGNNMWVDSLFGRPLYRVRRKDVVVEDNIANVRQAVEIAQEFIVAHLRLKG